MTRYDEWFEEWNNHTTSSACIVRVTNKCNEKCIHCAFRSGPECVGCMSLKTCEMVNKWIPSSIAPNVMGGEITILQEYPDIRN